MALLDIVSNGQSGSIFFNRGNIGVLTDITAKAYNSVRTPVVTGGGGGEHSYTF